MKLSQKNIVGSRAIIYIVAAACTIAACLLLAGCNFAEKINVAFNGEHVSCCNSDMSFDKNKDAELNLYIDYDSDPNAAWAHVPDPQGANAYPEGELTTPVCEYELLIENIHVYIDGQDNRDAFTWSYQRNDKNTLKINKDFLQNANDVRVECKATPRTATLTLYGLELDDDVKEQYKQGKIKLEFKKPYQNAGTQHIRTLSNGLAFPVYEDDDLDVTITSLGEMDLSNLWFRNNARYTEEGVDFTREISNGGKTITFHIPHYVIRDHGSFKAKED